MNGDVIRKELERVKMTQKELADAIYVTPQAVSKWINNQSQPTFDNIKMMSDVFGTNLANKLIASERRNKKIMKQHLELKELDSIEKAEKEAELLLQESSIEEHYSYSTYLLLKWMITASIGLTYHNYLHHKDDSSDEYTYDDIFFYLNNYFEECFEIKTQSQLEYDFYIMGGDLFESCGPDDMVNHDFCRDSMDLWYKVLKALDENIKPEFKVALVEIISNNSCY